MNRKLRTTLIIIDIGLIVVFICLLFFYYHLLVPLNKFGEQKLIIIEKGEGVEEIAKNLKTEKIIRNKWSFVYYTWLKNQEDKLQAGKYLLSPAMTIAEIISKLSSGEVVQDWAKLTIPEGWTNKQIKQRLINLDLISSEENIPLELQGYLFPDTYYFDQESTLEEVITRMRNNFDAKVDQKLLSEIEKQDKTVYDILLLASLLEKEVRGYEDMQIVSGIFWKRLENNYPLQSCATIAYILNQDKWRYSYEDTRIQSPYNTYLHAELPPTPINNPGLLAIKAAIYSQQSEYNFFLTDPETGETVFSKTLKEHNANKRKYFQ